MAEPDSVTRLPPIIHIGTTAVAIGPYRVTSTLQDGAVVHAEPHDTDDYRATAVSMGYGLDTGAMNRDHELTHHLVARMLGLAESPVMRAVADRTWTHGPRTLALEEAACMAVQSLARALGVDLVAVAA